MSFRRIQHAVVVQMLFWPEPACLPAARGLVFRCQDGRVIGLPRLSPTAAGIYMSEHFWADPGARRLFPPSWSFPPPLFCVFFFGRVDDQGHPGDAREAQQLHGQEGADHRVLPAGLQAR